MKIKSHMKLHKTDNHFSFTMVYIYFIKKPLNNSLYTLATVTYYYKLFQTS